MSAQSVDNPIHPLPDRIWHVLSVILGDRELLLYTGWLLLVGILALIGPYIVPHNYAEPATVNGSIVIAGEPSLAHPLGTNHLGQDVLSRLIIGARPTALTGFLGGGLIITIGTSIGVTAGYFGGWVENVLMRFTDVMYGVPLIPFAIVLLALFGFGTFTTIAVLGALLWRSSARVLRSQVLQIKERNFILAARATGMSSTAIVRKHFLPNIAPMILLFFALGIGFSILTQAGLAFIGVSDPFVPSWGIMIRNAYNNGYVGNVWWSLTPGIFIAMTVLSAFMFGRKYEEIATGEAGEEDVYLAAG